jgi:hypothetical protein
VQDARKRVKMEDDKWTYGQCYEWMIDTYFNGHFEEIKILEFLLVKCKREFDECRDDPKLQMRFARLGTKVKNDLEKLNKRTPEILKTVELMKRDLDSLK